MEDFSVQAAAQIYNVLVKEQFQKMPFEGIEIAKALSKLPFFPRFFDTSSEQFISLCINESAASYPPDTDIYSHEASTRYLYIVLEGTIQLTRGSRVQTVKLFGIFGETQLLFSLPRREEQTQTLTPCKCMRISEQNLLQLFTKRSVIENCQRYIAANEYFETLQDFEKKQLALKMEKICFTKSQVIVKEDEPIDSIIFVIYGQISVVKSLTIRHQLAEYEIDRLQQMASYGEYQMDKQYSSLVKLQCRTAGAYYRLNYNELAQCPHPVQVILQKHAIGYPDNEQLCFLHKVKFELQAAQHKVAVRSVLPDREHG